MLAKEHFLAAVEAYVVFVIWKRDVGTEIRGVGLPREMACLALLLPNSGTPPPTTIKEKRKKVSKKEENGAELYRICATVGQSIYGCRLFFCFFLLSASCARFHGRTILYIFFFSLLLATVRNPKTFAKFGNLLIFIFSGVGRRAESMHNKFGMP